MLNYLEMLRKYEILELLLKNKESNYFKNEYVSEYFQVHMYIETACSVSMISRKFLEISNLEEL